MIRDLVKFGIDGFLTALSGSKNYGLWLGMLLFFMVCGAIAYIQQFNEGLVTTGMTDHISWGFYIANFTFLVGVAASAVMVLIPYYLFKQKDFANVVIIAEGLSASALIMCLLFVTVDLGNPLAAWHLIPIIGLFNWPDSMLSWDMIVLNVYLVLNLTIPAYILFGKYRNSEPPQHFYFWAILLSVVWAFAIHLVTAFLLAGLPSRPFWNNPLLGPRFLASAFASGPAVIVLVIGTLRRFAGLKLEDTLLHKLGTIITIAAVINIIMLGSELFKEFYMPTEHSAGAQYLFYGLDEHSGLLYLMRLSVMLNVAATVALIFYHKTIKFLYPLCMALFLAVWIEKGLGLVIPGFIPGPLGDVMDYWPTIPEVMIAMGVWATGLFIFTVLSRVGIAVETGEMTAESTILFQ